MHVCVYGYVKGSLCDVCVCLFLCLCVCEGMMSVVIIMNVGMGAEDLVITPCEREDGR